MGAYLSGGLDSSLTTALVRKIAGSRLRSFSITFEDAEFDESSYQQEASSFLGTQHSNISCSRCGYRSRFSRGYPAHRAARAAHRAGADVLIVTVGA